MAKEKSRDFHLPFNLPVFGRGADSAGKAPPKLKLLFFIVDWDRAQVVSRVFEEEKVRFHFISKGRGTASSEILDVLGIGSSEKAVILCLEQEVLTPVLLKEVRRELNARGPGAGIAFTVPLSGINTPVLKVFKESVNKNEKIAAQGEGVMAEKTEISIGNDLIIAIINQGYSDELMTAAREAGARGGTVINARGLAHEGPVKFLGVSVQDEREIVVILTNRENKVPIMQAVSQRCGISSQAGGVIFSLPVDTVLGLSFD